MHLARGALLNFVPTAPWRRSRRNRSARAREFTPCLFPLPSCPPSACFNSSFSDTVVFLETARVERRRRPGGATRALCTRRRPRSPSEGETLHIPRAQRGRGGGRGAAVGNACSGASSRPNRRCESTAAGRRVAEGAPGPRRGPKLPWCAWRTCLQGGRIPTRPPMFQTAKRVLRYYTAPTPTSAIDRNDGSGEWKGALERLKGERRALGGKWQPAKGAGGVAGSRSSSLGVSAAPEGDHWSADCGRGPQAGRGGWERMGHEAEQLRYRAG